MKAADLDPQPDEHTTLTSPADPEDVGHGKRKIPPAPTGSRFKAVGTMVLAMRRFQASINPTVTFGKPSSSAGGSASSSGGVKEGTEAVTSAVRGPRSPSNQGKLQKTAKAESQRNRMATILRPLPQVEDE